MVINVYLTVSKQGDMQNGEVNKLSLIEKIAEDDEKAFRSFYDRYYFQVYRFSSYFVKSSVLVEEIVSDVFCAIWKHRKKLKDIDHFESYLYTITKNKALHYLSKEEKVSSIEIDQLSQDHSSHHETPEYLAIDKEISASLKEAIASLPDRCRTIFLMAREEGLKYKEIAKILSISEKTVNAQMVIAIKKLSQKIGKIVYFLF